MLLVLLVMRVLFVGERKEPMFVVVFVGSGERGVGGKVVGG